MKRVVYILSGELKTECVVGGVEAVHISGGKEVSCEFFLMRRGICIFLVKVSWTMHFFLAVPVVHFSLCGDIVQCVWEIFFQYMCGT